MDINEVKAAIGGQTAVPHQPEGGHDVQPLNPLGLDRQGAEPAPETVNAQQGAGSGSGGLTPGAQGSAADGTVEPGNDDNYSAQGGPEQLAPTPGISALTAGGNFGANRPLDGTAPAAAPVGRPDHALGRDQSLGQGINPMLKPANAPKSSGLFGKPSAGQ
jgi:hypothetical protein